MALLCRGMACCSEQHCAPAGMLLLTPLAHRLSGLPPTASACSRAALTPLCICCWSEPAQVVLLLAFDMLSSSSRNMLPLRPQ